MATFAERFKNLRLEKGLTQQQIADNFYCNKSSISRYESGNQIPEIDTLKQYAEFFSVSLDYLMGNSEYRNFESIPEQFQIKSEEVESRDVITNEIKQLVKKYDLLEIEALKTILESGLSLIELRDMLVRFEEVLQKKKKL